MKKNLIAVAVATAFAAPAAMADATLYGLANLSVWQSDVDGADEIAVNSVASRFGIKGSNDLGNGLKAIYQAEFQIDMATGGNTAGTDTIKNRNQFAGLAGGFGTVMLGNMDSPHKSAMGKIDMFGDTAGDMTDSTVNTGLTTSASIKGEDRVNNSLTYVSPKFEGVQVAIQSGQNTYDAASTAKQSTSYSISYTGVKDLYVAVSAQDDFDADNLGYTALSASYKMDNMQFGLIYEMQEGATSAADVDVALVNASYKMDKMTFALQYAMSSSDTAASDKDTNATLGVKYGFNKTTTGYAAVNMRDNDAENKDATAWQVGILTKF
jgi:predicted porin